MKKIAVVASGWHYPYQFYQGIAEQVLPKGWSMELFVISHRNPQFAIEEKKDKKFEGDRAYLDERLYSKVATVEDIEKLGWKYIEKPNTIGDWGNSNQWLEDHNYKDYDLFLFTHDDNLVLSRTWFREIIRDGSFKDWEILCNSLGAPEGWVRGSCEFFKPSLLEKMGGKFDLSETTLTREGETNATENIHELYDWNTTVNPLMKFIDKEKIKVGYMSPAYRVSAFCIEGERGYISNTHGGNTAREDMGLAYLKECKIL
jgi:uncharacterized protein (DUF1330 family)